MRKQSLVEEIYKMGFYLQINRSEKNIFKDDITFFEKEYPNGCKASIPVDLSVFEKTIDVLVPLTFHIPPAEIRGCLGFDDFLDSFSERFRYDYAEYEKDYSGIYKLLKKYKKEDK